MEAKSSFESIQSLLSSHLRPKSQIVHSQLASEANYIHLLTSLQPPAKFPPDDEFERLEGQQRAAATVLLFSSLEDAGKTMRKITWNHLKRVALFQGDNFAEYYSSVGSVSKLKDVEVLQNCERALLRHASRRIAVAFVRWREWTRWMRRETLGFLVCGIQRCYRNRLSFAFSRLFSTAERHKHIRQHHLSRVNVLWLAVTSHGYGGVRQAFSTWKQGVSVYRANYEAALHTRLLKFKNYEARVVSSCLSAGEVSRTRVKLRFFNRWRSGRWRTRREKREAVCDAMAEPWDEERAVLEVKKLLLDMTSDLVKGFQFLS